MEFLIEIIIIAIVVYVVYSKFLKPTPPQNTTPQPTPNPAPVPSPAPNVNVDQTIINTFVFLETVAISLAHTKSPKDNEIHHGFIRCSAGDNNSFSYVEFSGAIYRITNGFDELRNLLTNETVENASRFLEIAGFPGVSAVDFLRYISIGKTSLQEQFFSVSYETKVPSGMGSVYHDLLLKRFKEKWPYSSFECEYGDIDLSI